MPRMIIKGYEATIQNDWYEDGASVLIGVVNAEHPEEAFEQCWADERIYFYVSSYEMSNLKVGDVLNDGEDFTIVDIDKSNPHIFVCEYELEEA
jgi:hypothetical protein